MLKILAAIDGGEQMEPGEHPGHNFGDGFEIIIEYQIYEELIMHEDMVHDLVSMKDGVCCLNDDRVRTSENGSVLLQFIHKNQQGSTSCSAGFVYVFPQRFSYSARSFSRAFFSMRDT